MRKSKQRMTSPRIMRSKFNNTCEETGHRIKKGEKILYDPRIRRAYCENSPTYKQFIKSGNRAQEVDPPVEPELKPDPAAAYIEEVLNHNHSRQF